MNPLQLRESTGMSQDEVDNALRYLVYVDAARRYDEDGPETFGLSGQRSFEEFAQLERRIFFDDMRARPRSKSSSVTQIPLTPFGWGPADPEVVARKRLRTDRLYAVMGLQYKSHFYDAKRLVRNVRKMLSRTVKATNEARPGNQVKLRFKKLAGNLGEHVFSSVARSIVGADIAIFDASDCNPNVMIELGVALTHGVTVVPLRAKKCKKLPSDISGLMWLRYENSFSTVLTDNPLSKFKTLVRSALKRKAQMAAHYAPHGRIEPNSQG